MGLMSSCGPAEQPRSAAAPTPANDPILEEARRYHEMALKVDDNVYKSLGNLVGMELIPAAAKARIKSLADRYQRWRANFEPVASGDVIPDAHEGHDHGQQEPLTTKLSPTAILAQQRAQLDTINAIQIAIMELRLN